MPDRRRRTGRSAVQPYRLSSFQSEVSDLVRRVSVALRMPPMTPDLAGVPERLMNVETRVVDSTPPRASRPPVAAATGEIDTEHSDTEHSGAEHVDAGHIDAGHIDAGHIDAGHVETWTLVQAAQHGDGDAFGQLYDRYFDSVYRFVYYRVNDRALAEDFTSETFLRALRRIGSISYQGRDVGAWLMTIARNIIFDYSKSARHRLEVPTAEFFEGDDLAQSPESAVIGELTLDVLMSGVKQLNDEQRECVVLRFIQGLSVSETAAAMGKNDGAVKALQHRAVRKLADVVGPQLR